MRERLIQYALLMRLHKPIGMLLLLWPTLWALWLAADGMPDAKLLTIFVLGVIITRSAGCIINDIADRNVDGKVARTRLRPLVSGKASVKEALLLFGSLCALAFLLALQLNRLTLGCAFIGAALMVLYPFMKRYTHLPQVWLGMAFTWGVPMAFAAQTGKLSGEAWFLFGAAMIWVVIYDTLYAMTDREDDLKAGIKSTAILFGRADKKIVGLLQLLFVLALIALAIYWQLGVVFYFSIAAVFLLFIYQQQLIKDRVPQKCFQAFLNNNWVGLFLFLGIILK